jgi:hypothetical protein
MGCFDSLLVRCKKCGEELEFQSKADACCQREFTLSTCPPKIITDLDGEIQECDNCGAKIRLVLAMRPTIRAEIYVDAEDEDDE